MTTLFIILGLIAIAITLPKTTIIFQVVLDLLVIAFYAMALIIMAYVAMRSYQTNDYSNPNSAGKEKLNQA